MRRKAKAIHILLRRTGLYNYALKNLFKAIFSTVLIIALFLVLQKLFLKDLFLAINLPSSFPALMFGAFFLSESFLGILPPDLFILWTMQYENFWFMLSLLAILSYLGGIVAYQIGSLIGENSLVHRWIHKQFDRHKKDVQRWGGFVIIIAALTPLPFSPISILAGTLEFPFKKYYIFALSRLARYFIYALVLMYFTA
ncbi:MAG: VTT domain-containing protein [Bacteroidetes bacterium]|nr:VTT domain-containing protein [Bacteroidota bacterium]